MDRPVDGSTRRRQYPGQVGTESTGLPGHQELAQVLVAVRNAAFIPSGGQMPLLIPCAQSPMCPVLAARVMRISTDEAAVLAESWCSAYQMRW
ncbi:hypothetical protein CA983_06285 [Streptomyces swartbergensis]|uniref:Uncharacterized protein n=1 Tax=Streptomyces swartbergensis TaxID=487165 RepID=A0A243S8S7_9ACTN|nr:hypothetical protein CA983_06285 [Streptomyces swartbergensis]